MYTFKQHVLRNAVVRFIEWLTNVHILCLFLVRVEKVEL